MMDEIKVKTLFHSDIVYHLLAHMDLPGNPSNLYSPQYIHNIAEARPGSINELIVALRALRDSYESNFHRLSHINFIPYYTKDFSELVITLENYAEFTLEDKKTFIEPFVTLLINEKEFYERYWQNSLTDNDENIGAFEKYLSENLAPLNTLFLNTNLKPNIFVSLSMTTFGRGFYMEGFLSAAVPLPNGPKGYEGAFFQMIHEFTHQLTDSLLESGIRMDDGSHQLSEIIAVVAGYYIFHRLYHKKLGNYLQWLNLGFNNQSKNITTDNFTSEFPLPKKIYSSLVELVDQLCQ